MGAGLTVLVLGPVEARAPSGPIPVSGSKLQVLVAMLALAAPHPVSDDRLIEEIWGDDPPGNPANSLQAQVSQLRRLLGREVVARQGAGYALVVPPDAVDAQRFEQMAAAARDASDAGDHRGAAQTLRGALALVRGPVLGDLLDHERLQAAAAALEERVLAVQEALGDAELASGRHAEIVGPLAELARAHPLRERFAAQLILALYRCGRQVDALQAYAQVREALVEEFGVEPGAELRRIEAQVLAHDPALAAPEPVPAPIAPVAPPSAPGVGEVGPDDAFHHTPGRLPLVGREPELEVLRADLADVLRGRGRVGVIVGEPGIGKTRLTQEVADEALSAGAAVGWGRSHDGQGDVAFRVWSQVVATLVERVPAPLVAEALGRGAADIARIAPEVRDLGLDLVAGDAGDPGLAQARLADALAAFLRALSQARPLMVVLDDIQWADPASLRVLAVIVREIADARILMLATYRSVGAPAHTQLADALAVVVRQPIARRFDLDGLDRDALGALVEASGGARTDEEVAIIHRRTQGNPFFAVEILRLMAGGEAVDADDVAVPSSVREAGGTRPLPSGVREVVRQRIGELPAATAEVLEAAAVLGPEIDLTTLALGLGTGAAEVLDHLEPAREAGIVVDGAGPLALRFAHGLVSETLYADLTVTAKLRGHLRAADALAARHGRGDGPHLADIAAHRCRAVPVGSVDDAVAASLVATRWLMQHLAHQQADDLLVRALDLIATQPAGPERDAMELRVMDRLWLLRIMTGGYGTPGVVEAVAHMSELCVAIDDARVVAPVVWRLVNYVCVAGEFAEARRLSSRLLAAADDDPSVARAAHLAMGITLTHLGDIDEAAPHFDAIDVVPPGQDEGTAAAYTAWHHILAGKEGSADALIVAAAERFDGVGGYPSAITGWFSVLVATLRRDAAAALERCERWIPFARSRGFGVFVGYMTVCRGWAVAVSDDVEVGVAEMDAAAAQITATGARMLANVFHGLRADALLVADRPEEALASADEALRIVERHGERWFEAELHRLRGRALLGIDPADPAGAETLRTAVAVATAQGSVTFARRAEADLAQVSEQGTIS
jgi:DNA-binding SARP family transcriptional activator